MRFNIVLPGLLSPAINTTQPLYLERLIRHAKITSLNLSYSDIILGVDYKIGESIAMQLAKRYELEVYSHYVICEPTSLRLDGNMLVISESSLLQLDFSECSNIINDLNLYFAKRAKFFYINDSCWLMGVNELDSTLANLSILDILGQDINQYMSNNIQINQIINETQMILASHNVNKVRDKEGSLNFNSIWLWDRVITRSFDCDASVILATGELSGIVTSSSYISQDITSVAHDHNTLLVFDQLYSPSCMGDVHSWVCHANSLDNDFWRLIYNTKKNIKCINLYMPYHNITLKAQITSLDKFKLWRNNNFNKLMKDYNEI